MNHTIKELLVAAESCVAIIQDFNELLKDRTRVHLIKNKVEQISMVK